MKHLLLFFTLFFCLKVFSQYEYRPGYIVKLDGTSEEGLINFRGSAYNAKKCEFKKNEGAEPVVYSPNEISAYRFTDSKYFESKNVTVENVDTILFLECLISGKASIYFTVRKSVSYYFLEKEDGLVELDNDVIDVYRDGIKYQRESKQYIRVLKYHLRDCPPIVKRLDNARLTKKSLINLSKEYHEYVCDDEPCIVYEKMQPQNHVQLGADFSFGSSKLEFENVALRTSMGHSFNYQVGVISQINLDEEGAFNLKAALRYYSYKNELLSDSSYLAGGMHPSDISYGYSILKPEIQLKYKMKFGKIVSYASAGFFTSYFLTDEGKIENEKLASEINFSSRGMGSVSEKLDKLSMFGFVGEVGVETKLQSGNLSLSLYFERFQTHPFRTSYNLGLRCGYYAYLN